VPLPATETSFLSLVTSSNTLGRMQIYRAILLSIVCANNDVFEGLTSRLEVTSDLTRGLSMVSRGLSFDCVERPRPGPVLRYLSNDLSDSRIRGESGRLRSTL
jgi:hypothetical protein